MIIRLHFLLFLYFLSSFQSFPAIFIPAFYIIFTSSVTLLHSLKPQHSLKLPQEAEGEGEERKDSMTTGEISLREKNSAHEILSNKILLLATTIKT